MQAEEISPRSAVSPAPAEKYLPSARQLFLVLAIYFAAHVVIRTFLSNTTDMDESDQLVLTQKLSWGYGPQPPLYSWVQIGFFQIFGMGIFALALWKFILLFTTHVLTYYNVRFITRSHICAVAGVAALFLFHQFAWESVRDLTHSVLATTLAAGTLLTLMKVQQNRAVDGYLLLGICIGLGFLAKYNFVVVAGGLIAAGLTLPEYRRAILNPRFALTVIIAGLVVLPNVVWMLHHRDLLLVTAYKFRVHQGNLWMIVLRGLANLSLACLTFLGPFVAVFGVLLWAQGWGPFRLHTEHEKLILRSLIFTVAGFVAAILFAHSTGFRDRWFQPIFIGVPVLVIGAFRERIDLRFARRAVTIATVVMVMVLVLIPARVVYSEKFHLLTHLNNPYDTFAAQLRPSLENINTIVCDDRMMAGNLRLSIPGKIFISPELVPVLANDTNRFMLAWEMTKSDAPPPNIVEFMKTFGVTNIDALSPDLIQATYKHYRTKTMQIGCAILDAQAMKQKLAVVAP